MDCIDQFPTRKRMRPGLVLTTASTHFGDDHKTVRIRMQCPLNHLIGHMWTIVVAGINVVHPHRDCLSQNLDGSVDIARRSPDLRTSELHCTVAHPVHVHCRIRKCERASELCLFCHLCLSFLRFLKTTAYLRERLSNEFFASLPKCLSIIWVQRVSSDPLATDVKRHVVRNNVADVAVLAISATDLVCGPNNCSPHRSCSPLWN